MLIFTLLITVSIIFCAEQKKPSTTTKDLLEEVHKCPGLRGMSEEHLSPLVFNDTIRKSCPALGPWYKSLPYINKCIAREVAVQAGDDSRTWGETLFAGSGCYKISRNRAEATTCNTNPDLRRKLTLIWCLESTKTYKKR